jgi:hypothetical protein
VRANDLIQDQIYSNKTGHQHPVVVYHANFVSGQDKKIHLLKDSGFWFLGQTETSGSALNFCPKTALPPKAPTFNDRNGNPRFLAPPDLAGGDHRKEQTKPLSDTAYARKLELVKLELRRKPLP